MGKYFFKSEQNHSQIKRLEFEGSVTGPAGHQAGTGQGVTAGRLPQGCSSSCASAPSSSGRTGG